MTYTGNPVAAHASGGQSFWKPTPSLGNSGLIGPGYLDRSLIAVRADESVSGPGWLNEPALAPIAGSSLNGYTMASFNGTTQFLQVPVDLHSVVGVPIDWFYTDIQSFLWDRGLQYPDYWASIHQDTGHPAGYWFPDSTDLRRDDLADAQTWPDVLNNPPNPGIGYPLPLVGLGLQRAFTFILLIKPASAAAPLYPGDPQQGLDPQIICDEPGFVGVAYTTDGATAWCYIDGSPISVTAPCPVGVLSLVEVRYKGSPDGTSYWNVGHTGPSAAATSGEFSIRVSQVGAEGSWVNLTGLTNDLGFANGGFIVGCNFRAGNGPFEDPFETSTIESAFFHGEMANISTAAKWWSDAELARFRKYLNKRYKTAFVTTP